MSEQDGGPHVDGTEPPDQIVVRAGEMKREDARLAAETCQEAHDMFGISVWSWPNMTAEEIVQRAKELAEAEGRPNPVPHPAMRVSTLARLTAGNLPIRQTFREGHHTLMLDAQPVEDALDSLEHSFDQPQPNPARNPHEKRRR